MIRQYTFTITPPDDERLHFNVGSVMHGFLIEALPAAVAQYLHSTAIRPYSQYVQVKNNIGLWRINALNEEMCNYIEKLAKLWDENSIFLKQRGKSYKLRLCSVSPKYSYQDFSRYFFITAEPSRSLRVRFITPTSFKVYGQYQLFPDIRLLLASIWKKWNGLSDSVVFEDEQAFKEICDSTFIKAYRLSSMRFALEKIKITGFSGDIELAIKGPDMTLRWVNMLVAYGAFCGSGIKTALGMGAMEVQRKQHSVGTSTKMIDMEERVNKGEFL